MGCRKKFPFSYISEHLYMNLWTEKWKKSRNSKMATMKQLEGGGREGESLYPISSTIVNEQVLIFFSIMFCVHWPIEQNWFFSLGAQLRCVFGVLWELGCVHILKLFLNCLSMLLFLCAPYWIWVKHRSIKI